MHFKYFLYIAYLNQVVMIDFSQFDNLISLTMYFNSNDVCKKAIVESRWSDGDMVCPYCGEHHCVERTDGRFRCKHCRRNFSCLVWTIFENTNLPLIKCFVAKLMRFVFCVGLQVSIHTGSILWHSLYRGKIWC